MVDALLLKARQKDRIAQMNAATFGARGDVLSGVIRAEADVLWRVSEPDIVSLLSYSAPASFRMDQPITGLTPADLDD